MAVHGLAGGSRRPASIVEQLARSIAVPLTLAAGAALFPSKHYSGSLLLP